MVGILQSLSKTIHLSIVLAVLLFLGLFLLVVNGLLIGFSGVGYLGIFTFWRELCGSVCFGT